MQEGVGRNWGQRGAHGIGRALPVLLALSLALGGCFLASAPPDRRVTLPDPPKDSGAPPPAVREHQRILAAYSGTYEDERLEGLIRQAVDKLIAASERPDQRYRITILNSPAINAFALPSGQLYVTRGLLSLANDTSELASVLSHEMAHVIAQHATIREERARQVALLTRVFDNLGGNDPETSALALAKSKIKLATFSREQELEADGIGVGIAARAGYDPYGAVRFLTSMGRNSDLKPSTRVQLDPRAADFLSSHPATPERVRVAQSNARQYSAPGSGERDREAYLASVDGLIYGEDPSEGFARGRRFLHPKLGFTFLAPQGFTLDNTAQAILGVKEGGGQAMRLDVVRVPAEQKLSDYLTSGWIEGIEQNSIESLGVNDFPAATAIAKGDQWSFRIYAVRFSTDVYRFIFAAKKLTPEIDRTFHDAVVSFRRMSLAESSSAKPLRIRVVTASEDDTVEKLAARMALHDHPIERFRILNGLTATDRVKPGDQVKIVTE
jgi:predicted Zn-dependent protease